MPKIYRYKDNTLEDAMSRFYFAELIATESQREIHSSYLSIRCDYRLEVNAKGKLQCILIVYNAKETNRD